MTMSLSNVRHFFGTLYQRYMFSLPAIHLSRTQKILVICFTGGSIILGGLAQFLKRRRRHPIPSSRKHYREYKTRLGSVKNSTFGLEALEKALYCWEDALTAFSSTLGNDTLALPSKADAAFTHDVQELLDMGYQMQSHAELLFLDQ
ncbi:hypothetical protein P5V15_007749, partial [Pogonomyrmex californicus]